MGLIILKSSLLLVLIFSRLLDKVALSIYLRAVKNKVCNKGSKQVEGPVKI